MLSSPGQTVLIVKPPALPEDTYSSLVPIMPTLPVDLVEQLRRQLKFIATSCRAYDQGEIEEALRIAVSLRVLFHDTGSSTSIFTQLGKKGSVHLISTIGLGKTDQELGSSMVLSIPIMLTMNGVQPPLEDGPQPRVITCDAWWNEIVMSQNQRFSRRDVVLSSANQDGGAHVDSAPDQKTLELKEGIGTFTSTVDNVPVTKELTDHHFPMLRQFGYEVLNSPEITSLA